MAAASWKARWTRAGEGVGDAGVVKMSLQASRGLTCEQAEEMRVRVWVMNEGCVVCGGTQLVHDVSRDGRGGGGHMLHSRRKQPRSWGASLERRSIAHEVKHVNTIGLQVILKACEACSRSSDRQTQSSNRSSSNNQQQAPAARAAPCGGEAHDHK